MTTETVLDEVGQHERRHARHRFKLSDRFAEIFFLEIIKIEVVEGLEHALQVLFQPNRRRDCGG